MGATSLAVSALNNPDYDRCLTSSASLAHERLLEIEESMPQNQKEMRPLLPDFEKILGLATQAAIKAGELVVEMRSKRSVLVDYKAERNLVTSADLAAEKLIVSMIQSTFPVYHILSEEQFPQIEARTLYEGGTWVIDPVDGTTNYARGHLHVGVSIAFAWNGAVECAVVHAPFLHETYTALRGKGARLNSQPLQVNRDVTLGKALVGTGFPYERDNLVGLAQRVAAILEHCQDLRRIGACSLDISWIAAGRLDAFYESVSPWDMAAATLIAREAGALATNLYPRPANTSIPSDLDGQKLLVAAPPIFEELRTILNGLA